MSTFLPIVPGSLPPGYCWPDPQTYNRDILTIATVLLPDTFGKIWSSDVEPPVDKRDYIWFYTPTQRLYFYVNGVWQRTFEISPSSKKLYPFWGSASDVNTEDGGSAGTVGDSTGPLWVIDSTMIGRTHVGVGLVPGTSMPVLTLGEGDLGGEGQHALTGDENGPHTHITNIPRDGAAPDTQDSTAIATHVPSDTLPWPSDSSGLGNPHQNMQPYKAGYWLRRTARIYVQPPN